MNAVDRAVMESIDRVIEKILGDSIRKNFGEVLQKKIEETICQQVAAAIVGKLDKKIEAMAAEVESALSQVTDITTKVKESLRRADRDIRTKIEGAVASLDVTITPSDKYKERLGEIVADLIIKVACSSDSRTGSNILVPLLKEKILARVKEMKIV